MPVIEITSSSSESGQSNVHRISSHNDDGPAAATLPPKRGIAQLVGKQLSADSQLHEPIPAASQSRSSSDESSSSNENDNSEVKIRSPHNAISPLKRKIAQLDGKQLSTNS
jgi:hypothetical protein